MQKCIAKSCEDLCEGSFCHYHDEVLCKHILKNGKRCAQSRRFGQQYNNMCGIHWKLYPLSESEMQQHQREHEENLKKEEEELQEKIKKIWDESAERMKRSREEHEERMKRQREEFQGRREEFAKAKKKKPNSVLEAEGIFSNDDFKKWARNHHPDKGGDTKLFQEVSFLVRQKMW
uniref:J domain-containing protein n=1 Tax=viral metagenome TaxID=1070528 RepID=A0A6C0KUV0_9ZZZZ